MIEKSHFGRPIPKSVAIVAMGQSRLDFGTHAISIGNCANIADEIWAINKMISHIPSDLCFRMDDLMHNREMMPGPYLELLKMHPLLVTSKAYPKEFPNSVEFPLIEVLENIGIPYFNTTPAYALAYAMYLEIPRVHIYGCDYTYPDKLMQEEGRGCFEMLMGMAFVRGIDLLLGPNTSLLDTCIPIGERFYGYKDHPEIDFVGGKWKITKTPMPETVSNDVGEED